MAFNLRVLALFPLTLQQKHFIFSKLSILSKWGSSWSLVITVSFLAAQMDRVFQERSAGHSRGSTRSQGHRRKTLSHRPGPTKKDHKDQFNKWNKTAVFATVTFGMIRDHPGMLRLLGFYCASTFMYGAERHRRGYNATKRKMLCWASAGLSKSVGFIGCHGQCLCEAEPVEGAIATSRLFSRDMDWLNFHLTRVKAEKNQLNMTGGIGTFPEASHRYRKLYEVESFM